MAALRAPDGCPWDREQTHATLALHLLEEAHEALDAIDRGDHAALEEELGDLLLQVVFHAQLGSEAGAFDAAGVVDGLVEKLIARHPHVFGDVKVSGAGEVLANWETLKHAQKQRTSAADDLPRTLPALVLAHKVQRRLGDRAGGAPPSERIAKPAAALAGADASTHEGRAAAMEALGELLWEVVQVATSLGVDPEGALRRHAMAEASRARTGDPPAAG